MDRIFIVDDHPAIRESYAGAIADTDDLVVCGTAASFEEALQGLPEAQPDLSLMDISLGADAPDGIELIRQLQAAMEGEAPCWLVVSAHDDQATAERALGAGADRFLSKRDAGHALLTMIRDVLNDREG